MKDNINLTNIIKERDKSKLYNLFDKKEISFDILLSTILEIANSVTDWYKLKQNLKSKYNNFINTIKIK